MDRSEWTGAIRADAVRDALREHGDELRRAGEVHDHPGAESVRAVTYRGHEIVIRTSYEITVDGHPFPVSATVDNDGRVHYHGLPTRNFASAVELVQNAIDAFPGDFAAGPHEPDPHPDPDGHGHGHGHPGHPQGEPGRSAQEPEAGS